MHVASILEYVQNMHLVHTRVLEGPRLAWMHVGAHARRGSAIFARPFWWPREVRAALRLFCGLASVAGQELHRWSLVEGELWEISDFVKTHWQ
jgi:hypothetical protein